MEVILLERVEKLGAIGDVVKVDNFEGRITDISTRYTVIRALNGREAIVPNEMMITQRVENSSLADARVLREYQRSVARPGAAHAICEDYRASATIDLDHDRRDRDVDVRVAAPLLVLWGLHGVIQQCFDPLAEWRLVASDVRGHGIPCGHYIAEEAPDALLEAALPFLLR